MRLPRILVENWGLKLFSLALGIVIFLAVRNEQRLSTSVAVRLVVHEPASLVNTGEIPPEVLVKVSAPWGTLQTFDAADLPPIELDLADLPRGTSTVRIHEQQLGLPPEVDVISISPSMLTVRLENREKRKVPVKAVVRGEPATGFGLGKATVEPAEVEIDGPRREVREVSAVRSTAVDVAGARETVIAPVSLEAPAAHTRIVGQGRVTVRVPVEPLIAERTVRLRVAVPGGPRPIAAVLRGPKAALDAIDEASLRATPEPGNRSRRVVPVRIEGLPAGVTVAEPVPLVRVR